MGKGFLIALTIVLVTTLPAGAQGFGERLQKSLKGLGNRIERGAQSLERKIQPRENRTVQVTQGRGTCDVFATNGQKIDSEPCRIEQSCVSASKCISRFFWPSGAITVIEYQNGTPYRINGSGLRVTMIEGNACSINETSGNTFCYWPAGTMPSTQVANPVPAPFPDPPPAPTADHAGKTAGNTRPANRPDETFVGLVSKALGIDVQRQPLPPAPSAQEIAKPKHNPGQFTLKDFMFQPPYSPPDKPSNPTGENLGRSNTAIPGIDYSTSGRQAESETSRQAANGTGPSVKAEKPDTRPDPKPAASPPKIAAAPSVSPQMKYLADKLEAYKKMEPGLATLVATNDFTLSFAELNALNIRMNQYRQYFHSQISAARRASLDAAQDAIVAHFDAVGVDDFDKLNDDACSDELVGHYRLNFGLYRIQDTALSILTAACKKHRDKRAMEIALGVAQAEIDRVHATPPTYENWLAGNWLIMDTRDAIKLPLYYRDIALNHFKDGTRAHYRQTENDSESKLRHAYALAKPQTDDAKAAQQNCSRLSPRSDKIAQLCAKLNQEMKKKFDQLNCDRAVEGFGATTDFMKERLYFGNIATTLSDLVCRGGVNRPGYEYQFNSSFFSNPAIVVKDEDRQTVLEIVIRKTDENEGRSFKRLLLDIATGENEKPVTEFYIADHIKVAKGPFAPFKNPSVAMTCAFLNQQCR